MKYYFLILAAFVAGLIGCNSKPDPAKHHQEMMARMDSLKADLVKTDIAFSEYSAQKGRNAAFIEYAADNATFLRPFSMPVTGKDTITKLLNNHPDSMYVLTWIPIRAEIARSGDLGFTYGTYSLQIKNIGKEEGTYCTVWKKDKDHKWRFVLDTGNEGLKYEDKAEDKEIKAEVKKEVKKEATKKH